MLVRDVLSKFAPMRKEPENPASPSILRWRAKQPILGRISLWVLGATPLVTIGSFFIPWHVSSGEGEMVPFIIGLGIGGLCAWSMSQSRALRWHGEKIHGGQPSPDLF